MVPLRTVQPRRIISPAVELNRRFHVAARTIWPTFCIILDTLIVIVIVAAGLSLPAEIAFTTRLDRNTARRRVDESRSQWAEIQPFSGRRHGRAEEETGSVLFLEMEGEPRVSFKPEFFDNGLRIGAGRLHGRSANIYV